MSTVVLPFENSPKRILCIPVDESENAKRAVDWAIQSMYRSGDGIRLLHVRQEAQPSLLISPTFGYEEMIQQMNHSFLKASEELLETIAGGVTRQGIPVEAISIPGDPRHALVEELQQRKPCMVVMGQRGTGPQSRDIMGSVSDYLVKHAPVPVIVIR
jgi:nucleotide-binding universal stress UspA family protein